MNKAAEPTPRVSVVIPAYNAEAHIGEAIESVLAQTLPAAELIVVDDGAEDRTGKIASSYEGVELIVQPNAGPSAARNNGVAQTTGELLTFLDADDLMTPRRLELQAAHLRDNPAVEIVFGAQEVRAEPGARLPFWAEDSPVPTREIGPGEIERTYPMTMFLRRRAWDLVGPFDETMRMAEDLDWTLRASELGLPMAVLDDVVTIRRVHAGNVTHDSVASREGTFEAFRKRIERNRARS